jgi:hypothetical protein
MKGMQQEIAWRGAWPSVARKQNQMDGGNPC